MEPARLGDELNRLGQSVGMPWLHPGHFHPGLSMAWNLESNSKLKTTIPRKYCNLTMVGPTYA